MNDEVDNTPWKRVFVDIPTATHKKLTVRAREARMSMKAYLAMLIERDANPVSKSKVIK